MNACSQNDVFRLIRKIDCNCVTTYDNEEDIMLHYNDHEDGELVFSTFSQSSYIKVVIIEFAIRCMSLEVAHIFNLLAEGTQMY